MDRYARGFRITVYAGIAANLLLALPAVFAPDAFLVALGFDPAYPNLWVRLAAWLVVLLSLFYAPGARDLDRYRANAVLSVFARSTGFLFFASMVLLLGFTSRLWLFAALDLAVAVPSGVFLLLAVRAEEARRRNASTPHPGAKHEARAAQTV